ncbi:MAG: argininosuccinate lyase [Phycisphaeraceae bacterium]|nr:MAG: argininosuccinate lyase [Phycisphaeraceae bacterium]
MALWGGRFEGGGVDDALFRALNDSLAVDHRLLREDIEGSIGWAAALGKAGVLSPDDVASITAALGTLKDEAGREPGKVLEAVGRDEDVHSYVERRLIEMIGPAGKKLHTGRSRNDQVATDVRMWTRRAIDERLTELRAARASLIDLAAREAGTVMPGYTHLQRAQPVLMAHWALAYEEMLARDADRLRDARARVNVMPLGSAALAGTTYPIDRHALAASLGFDAPSRNSLDATAGRDFIAETLFVLSQLAVHLSRMAEDLIIFSTSEFGFVEMSEGVTSGSSLMPQKKNPDACELLRGKSARVVGNLVSMLAVTKGLPLAYNKDLQGDKTLLFESMNEASLCLRVTPAILDGLRVDRERCRSAAAGGFANATELADYLVSKGVPFREAHDRVGRLVRAAIDRGVALEGLTVDEMRSIAGGEVNHDVYAWLTLEAGLTRREVHGGTGPAAVASALGAARERLSAEG